VAVRAHVEHGAAAAAAANVRHLEAKVKVFIFGKIFFFLFSKTVGHF
jgi:hypothetical protein